VVESGDVAYLMGGSKPTAQLEAVADAFKLMHYTAVGVGPIDIRFGETYYKTFKDRGIPVVHVDVTEHDGVQPYLIKDIAGVKVGIVSFGAVPPDRKDDFDLLKRRYQVFAEARRNCDVLILLDQGSVATDDWLERNANRFGSPDIVVGGGTRILMQAPKQIGQTMVVPTSTQGMYVGRVDVEIVGTEKKMTYARVEMERTINDEPDVLAMVNAYMEQQRSAWGRSAAPAVVTAAEAFSSYQSCIPCHRSQYEQWKTTRHAAALRTLMDQNKAIPDCLPCHSEAFKRTARIAVNPDQLGGVECASCHSNVLPHGADFRKRGDTGAIRAQCPECHTKDRSPDFDPITAYEAVKHTGK